ncbi:MAG: class I SAM-dependent methyltransferase [Chloroflexota bacterium]
MTKPVDFSFDERVARRYDHQRAHPPSVSQDIGETLVRLVGQNNHLLEIGAGTGRIAKPAAAAGCRVTGIDISSEMLAAAGTQEDLSLLLADMQTLPFLDDAFDGVLAVHVLHLAKDWQAALAEAARVLHPDGVFIVGDDWIDPTSVIGALRDQMRLKVMELAPQMRPPSAGVSRADVLAQLGGTDTEEVIAATWTSHISPAARLAAVEQRIDAESWILPDDLFDAALEHLYAYARETWPDLDEPQPVNRRFVLKVTRGNWAGASASLP